MDQIHQGMTTCRVVLVLFMNHIPYGGPRDLQSPYRGSSCERNDIQYMLFLPILHVSSHESMCFDKICTTDSSNDAYKAFLRTGKLDDELKKRRFSFY
jgi:hypothetical protein